MQIHELIDGISDKSVYTTDFAFRLLFNGKILTQLVPGCPPESELCDVAILKRIVDPIATRSPDCVRRQPLASPTSSKEAVAKAQKLLTTTEGIFMFVGLASFGILLGSISTFVLLTGRLPCSRSQILDATEVDEDREARQCLQTASSYFDDELSDEDEPEFGRAAGRVNVLSTGM